ncbi:MAG TPA: hypothetical protein VIF82_04640 [Burkholderiaceae bacterium]|jgi:hypothetical protein
MSNSYIVNLERLHEGGTYAENLWRAFQVFIAALIGDNPTNKPQPQQLDSDRIKGINELYRLAKQFDATMPNQAAELRDLAARDPMDIDESRY